MKLFDTQPEYINFLHFIAHSLNAKYRLLRFMERKEMFFFSLDVVADRPYPRFGMKIRKNI